MKVLIIQSDGEHKGQDSFCRNDYLRECWALKHGFLANGIKDVTVWGKRHKNFKSKIDFNSFDLIFVAEQYDIEWVPDLSKITKPKKLHWLVDLHCLGPKHYRKISENCDVVLHSTRSLISKYRETVPNKKHVWFPNAVDDRFFNFAHYSHRKPVEKTEDFIFVGSDLQERRDVVNYAKKEAGLKTMFKTGEDMINAINGTKVHFHKSMFDDVAYRNFETIGLATCLMTNHISEMDDLGFKDGVNCLMYKNKEEIKDKLQNALENNRYHSIGMGGFVLSSAHTYRQRIRNLIKDRII